MRILPPLLVTALAVAPAAAAPIDEAWPLVSRVDDGDCTLEVRSNGRIYRIVADGLGSRADGRFRLTNDDMRPLDWSIEATESGRFARYYMPFRWHVRGGTVRVSVDSARCRLSTAFDWQRVTG